MPIFPDSDLLYRSKGRPGHEHLSYEAQTAVVF